MAIEISRLPPVQEIHGMCVGESSVGGQTPHRRDLIACFNFLNSALHRREETVVAGSRVAVVRPY